jgi:hypothetical protein
MAHVMIDLETWGRVPGCAIRSIGAVVFDADENILGERFYRNIDDASCEALGLTKDPETVQFWAEQSKAAQDALLDNCVPLAEALADFHKWFGNVGGVQVYGHGASFDPPILEAAFNACLLEAPWKFWDVRCCRTILAMANRKPDRRSTDVHHNALHDAEAQARAVMAAFRYGQFSAR